MARYLTIEDGREYLWDFDENRILLVTYGDTENIRQVEFSTDDTERPTTWTSEVMTNLTTGNKYVQIPNEFLNGEYSRLVCYVIAEDETGQHTRTKEIFRIKKRQQPEDYEITFTDRVYIRDLKAIAERYRDQAKQYSESAAASSTQAGQYNAQALASKNAAAESERNAEASMESAQSAQHSAESARNDANAILTLVQSKGTEITNFVATSKTELETQKNESLEEVRSVYTADLDELKGDITSEYKLFEVSDLTQGAWYADGIHETPNRICTSKLIPVKKGDKFTYKTNTLRVGFGLWVNGALQEYSEWVTSPSETTYIFQQDGDFFAQFSESNNANITPSSYDGISKLYTGIRYLVAQNANSIDSLRDEIGMHSYGCIVVNGTPQNVANTQCVYTSNKIPVKNGNHVSLKLERPLDSSASKYIFGVYGYNSSDSNIINLSPTARASLTSDYIVDNANVAYIQYAITEMDGNGNVVSVRASSFAGYETTAYVDENSDFYSYSYSGDYIDVKQKKYNVSATNLKIPTVEQIGAGSPQGFAMYNGKAIQLYANPSKLAIVNMIDSSVVATMDGNVGHGNTIDFFNEFEDAGDMFPLALVADGTSNEAYKVRIQTSGVTVKETIKFPIEHCGYYVSTMLDKLNSIIYTIGYYENSYNTNSGSNKMVIAKWDYSNLASNGDGSVTPEFIESFYVPYFTTLQGPTFYNGKLFVVSSPALAVSDTNIYVIDPVAKRICSLITEFVPNIKTSETEGLYFYDNGDSIECYLKNGDSAMAFFMMTFKG